MYTIRQAADMCNSKRKNQEVQNPTGHKKLSPVMLFKQTGILYFLYVIDTRMYWTFRKYLHLSSETYRKCPVEKRC